MDRRLSNVLRCVGSLALAAVLLYFSFREMDWMEFSRVLSSCRWGYVIAALCIGLVVYFIRALRWKMLLDPIDSSIPLISIFNSVNIGMMTNLVLPRVGELVRCGFITRHSSQDSDGKRLATVDKVFGTVLVERIWDMIFALLTMVLVFFLTWDRFGDFISENILSSAGAKTSTVLILCAVVVLLAALVFLSWKFSSRGGFFSKVWGVITGVFDGLKTCIHMKKAGRFLLYTLAVWICYWLTMECTLFALQGIGVGTDPGDALFLMFVGAISSLVPVPGGFGAYHALVAGAIAALWGLPFATGLIVATLSHETQTLAAILGGGFSSVYEAVVKRK